MNKINWAQKLSSRKFWAMTAAFAAALLIAFGATNGSVERVTAVITAGGVVVAYILGESKVDASRNNANGQDADE